VIADAIEAANWQLRIESGRARRRQYPNGSYTEQTFERNEKEAQEVIEKLRDRWTWTPYWFAFNSDYKRALRDPYYRALALQRYDANPTSTFSIGSDPITNWFIFLGGIFAVLMLMGIGAAFLKARSPRAAKPEQTSDTYGTASFAPARTFLPAGEDYVFKGVFFGKSSQPGSENISVENHAGAPVCSLPENHTLIVARTRTGKGTRVIIPTLLRTLMNSALVIDPKGELAAVTARTRRSPGKGLTSPVHILNPWGELAATFQNLGFAPATYNPLDILDRNDPNVVSTAQSLATAICPIGPGAKEPFWSQGAGTVLTAVLLWLTYQPGEQKTLARAREIVTLPRSDFRRDFLSKMAACNAFGGAIREHAATYVDLAQETYSGVMSNLTEHTKFLSDPQIKAATATSTFSMKDLMDLMTVYLVIPPDKMAVQHTWLRLLIAAGMQTFKHRPPMGEPGPRCMFLIDELPALGRLDDLPRDIATMAGYGVDFCLVIQGLDQLRKVYGDDATTIVNNCSYKWFCNISDLETAQYLSKTLGNKTVGTVGSSASSNFSPGGSSSGSSTSYGQTGRALLMPDEILNLGRETAILLAPAEKPNYLRPVDYWKLGTAFQSMREDYPHLYWEPDLTWDENPLPH